MSNDSGQEMKPIASPREAILGMIAEKTPGYEILNTLQQFGASMAMMTVRRAVQRGQLDQSSIHRIGDFGAGTGGPTWALTKIAEQIGATVDAIEQSETGTDEIIQSGILPHWHVKREDGIAYLETVGRDEAQRYDLITAFMLGPDDEEVSLFRKLANVSTRALLPGGHLIITSDGGTLENVLKLCQRSGAKFFGMDGLQSGEKWVAPPAIIIPQTSLAQIAATLPETTRGEIREYNYEAMPPKLEEHWIFRDEQRVDASVLAWQTAKGERYVLNTKGELIVIYNKGRASRDATSEDLERFRQTVEHTLSTNNNEHFSTFYHVHFPEAIERVKQKDKIK